MTDSSKSSSLQLPAVVEIAVGDAPSSWIAAGFNVERIDHTPVVHIGNIRIRLTAADVSGDSRPDISGDSRPDKRQRATAEQTELHQPGIQHWTIAGLSEEWLQEANDSHPNGSPALNAGARSVLLDGIETVAPAAPTSVTSRLDASANVKSHANLVTHLDHVVVTTKNMQRTVATFQRAGLELRRIRDIAPNQQAFFWAGETILEVVGPAEPLEISGSAKLWGLAMTSSDLDAAGQHLGAALGPIKSAVQQGRQIATLRGKDLGVSVPIVLMSKHARKQNPGSG